VSPPEVSIGSFCSTGSGSTPSSAKPEYFGGGIPWVKSGELWNNTIDHTEETVTQKGMQSARLKIVPRGSLLVAMHGATVGRTARLDIDATINQEICHICPDPTRAKAQYVWHALRAKMPELLARRGGGAQPNINQKIIRATKIPLPPLPEQRRIADVLDKADAIRRKREQAIALTEELLRSTFLEMFGDPVTNPKGWEEKPLGKVIERLDAGWSANGDSRPRSADEYGVLKISAVTSGVFRPEKHKAVSSAMASRALVTPRRGDLLLSRANTRELVAATCLVERDEPRLFLPDKIWRIVPFTHAATTSFLRYLMATPRFRARFVRTATGTSGSMLNVSKEKLWALSAPIPPLALQRKFTEIVWTGLHSKERQRRARIASDTLFASLVDAAFSVPPKSSP